MPGPSPTYHQVRLGEERFSVPSRNPVCRLAITSLCDREHAALSPGAGTIGSFGIAGDQPIEHLEALRK